MARINDLERGFEKTLAYAYGKHVVQGHLIMHNIDILGTEKQVTLLMALGDGAYNNAGEGAWGLTAGYDCGAGGGTPLGDPIFYADANQLAGQGFSDGAEVQPSFTDGSPNNYVMAVSRTLTGDWHAQTYDAGGQWPDSSQPSLIGFTEPLDCSSTNRNTGYTNGSTNSELLLPNEFMIAVVLKPTAFIGCWQNGQPTIITRRGKDAGGDFTGWELFLSVDTGDDTKAFIDFHTIDSGFGYPWHLMSSTAVIDVGTAYVITIICDGSTAYLRLNGTVIATSGSYAPAGSEPSGGSDLHYLCSGDGQNSPMGDYPYTKIWNQYPEQSTLLALEAELGTRFGITMATDPGGAPDTGSGGAWSPASNFSKQTNNDMLKTGGTTGTGDATAYTTPGFSGASPFDISFTYSSYANFDGIGIWIEDVNAVSGDHSSRQGWYSFNFFGLHCFVMIRNGNAGPYGEIADGYWYNTDPPKNMTLVADGAGTITFGGDGLGAGWSFSYDTSKTYRVMIQANGSVGYATVPAVSINSQVVNCIEVGASIADAVDAVYYGGRLIDPDNWHYHPGTWSTGKDDPIQGIDSFFPDGITYSGTAYIAIRLPVGAADDADPSKVAIVLTTSCIADYDIDGNMTEIGYSANPARIKADMLKRRGLHTRINWDSFVQARDWYDELIPWTAGDKVNDYVDSSGTPTYNSSGNVTNTSGALAKTTAVNGYDNTSKTQERVVYGQDGYFQITTSGDFSGTNGGGEAGFIDSTGKAWFGVSWGQGHFAWLANGVPIDDATIPYDYPASNPTTFKFSIEAGEFHLYQNGVEKFPPQGSSLVPVDTDLFGRVILWGANAGVSSSLFQGQTVVSSELTVSSVKRFEAHPAFTAPVDLTTGLDFVDSLCASDTQDAGDEIIFLTPATPSPRTSVFTFTEDVNANDVRIYRRDIRERPNRLSAQFRNLNRVYLDQDEVFETRDSLFDEVGYTIDPGALNFASMTGSQAQRLIKFNMRRMSDNDIFCDLTGMSDSFKLLPGDIVTVESDKLPDGAPKDFIILTSSRASGENTAYERSFTMQEWFSTDYSDTDHQPEQQTIVSPLPSPYAPPDAPVIVID